MQLHQLKLIHGRKSSKRIGRGGKRGTYSGRGIKGQKSRAGRRIRPAVRDLILRLPKRRGFKNKPLKSRPLILNLGDLENKLKMLPTDKKMVIDKNFLKNVGILPAKYRGDVKILGKGEIKTAVDVKDIAVSSSAKAKIEKVGGRVET